MNGGQGCAELNHLLVCILDVAGDRTDQVIVTASVCRLMWMLNLVGSDFDGHIRPSGYLS